MDFPAGEPQFTFPPKAVYRRIRRLTVTAYEYVIMGTPYLQHPPGDESCQEITSECFHF